MLAIMPYFMERKERTKDDIMPLNIQNSLSEHSGKLNSHEQEMAEFVFKTQLSTWTAHKLKQEWCSELDSSSDFDSTLGNWRDEEIAPHVSRESRLLSPANTHRFEILPNSVLGEEFQYAHCDDGESLSSSLETVSEDTNDSSVFEFNDVRLPLEVTAITPDAEHVLKTPVDEGNHCISSGSGIQEIKSNCEHDSINVIHGTEIADSLHSNATAVRGLNDKTENYIREIVGIPSKLMNFDQGNTLANEETCLHLQKQHIESFCHESQGVDRGVLPLYGCRKAQYITYEREFIGLLETEGQEAELKHPLTFDKSSPKDAICKRSPELGTSTAQNTIYLHTTETKTMYQYKPLVVETNGVTVPLGISSSAELRVSKDTSLDSEAKGALNRGWKDPGLKELSQTLKALDINESHVDTLHDMEEVLFDSGENNGAGFVYANRGCLLQFPKPYWNGGSNASDGHNLCQQNLSFQKIDSIEVVGAKQRKGGASLGEKLVGLKEYVVYQIRVRSERNQWDIEQRYRDFIHLYHQLKGMFGAQNDIQLPSPWENVEKESRKIFGIATNLVEVRSLLIQECLSSLIEAGAPFDTAPPLLLFLLPQRRSCDTTSASEDEEHINMEKVSGEKGSSYNFQSLDHLLPILHAGKIRNLGKQSEIEEISAFGKTIRLNVQIHPCKPFKQLLETQHYLCAGCYKQLDIANSLIQGFVQNIMLGKPRLCEYMGQLFCTSCHSNETAVLPSWVLQMWDFTPRPVSQLAKTYLDSIYDQPMLCVSAINPYILSKVPVLVHAMEMRKKLSKMFACIHCPARASIQQSLGSRRYLLESSDFFALRDLVDLSKGAFSGTAALYTGAGYAAEFLKVLGEHVRASIYPMASISACNLKFPSFEEGQALFIIMEDVLTKIHIHITQLCSICHLEAESCGVG